MDIAKYAYPELTLKDQTFKWCHRYAYDVLNGLIPAGKWVKLAAERHFRDINSENWYFDEESAQEIVDFFGFIPCKMDNVVYPSTTLLPWQIFMLCCLFGMKSKEDGLLKYNYCYAQIARKGGKSTLSGGITLFKLIKGGYAPQAFSAATTREQAAILWNAAKIMISQSPKLRTIFKVLQNEIRLPHKQGIFRPVASQSHTLDGKEPTISILDEAHAIVDRNLYEVLESAMGTIPDQLFLIITTAGFILDGLCTQLNRDGKAVLEQQVNQDSYFYLIAEIDEGDDPWLEENWYKANLGMAHGLPNIKTLRAQAEMAKISVEKKAGWYTKRLNIFVTGTDSWLDMDEVKACRDKSLNIDDFRGKECYIGIDKSQKNDITSFALLFPTPDGGCSVFLRNYLPEYAVQNASVLQQQIYKKSAALGNLILIPGKTIRDEYLIEEIRRLNKEFKPKVIAFDPWKMGEIAEDLEFESVPMLGMGQMMSNMSEPSTKLEALIKENRFKYDCNIFEYCATNAILKVNGQGNVRIEKEVYQNKIDAIVATVIALSCATLNKAPEINPYLSRPVLVF
ncbi:phage terminase, large subunit, putative [Moritella sp. PE36]|uniref:terminase large subunit n=1 Tax=Moritella sp. PE36 TaxID=58051 RepID=UPI0001569275|nr:terminase TerL endonuclease subunit [Moritella sp. PE36]EDM66151.1 phage terminase, large subunit, putative [Moritella sp. PE36]